MTERERCRRCGEARDGSQVSALAWVRDRERDGGVSWLCAGCARQNLRSIESKLPDDWW
ncbi:MAG TPA: hypothetical protein VGH89_17680 [Pseudonocardia sp.]